MTAEQNHIFRSPIFENPVGQTDAVTVSQSMHDSRDRRQQQRVAAFVHRRIVNKAGRAVTPVPVHNEL